MFQIKEVETIPDKEEDEEIIPEREYKQVQEELITEKMEKMTFESGRFLWCFVLDLSKVTLKRHSNFIYLYLQRKCSKNLKLELLCNYSFWLRL